MEKRRNGGNRSRIIISLVLLAIAIGYAVIRYNVIKGVAWENFPLFINNKGIALASVFLIAISFALGPLARFFPRTFAQYLPARKFFGLVGFGLAAVHGLISLIIFSPAYYPKFFTETGGLSLMGELSMLFGVLGFAIFTLVAISSLPKMEKSLGQDVWLRVQRTGYLAFAFVLLHVFFMGFEGWLKPEGWPGGLLPISLIAFIVIALTLLLRLLTLLFPRKK